MHYYYNEIDVVRSITGFQPLDLGQLTYLINKYNVDLDDFADEVELYCFQENDLNCAMFCCYTIIARNFLKDSWLSDDEEYEIFTNYMDSHLFFKNEYIQEIFEKYEP